MSKGQKTTTTQNLDPEMQKYRAQVWGAAQGAAGHPPPGVDPRSAEAAGYFSDYARRGNLGMGAMAGDESAIGALMNPYLSGVVDQTMGDFGRLGELTQKNVNDAATRAGAFGGSRHGVASGVALGDLARTQGQTLAGLRYQGFNDAMGRAGQLANFGMGAAGALQGIGEYNRGVAIESDPTLWKARTLQGAMQGMPYGTNTTSSTSQGLGSSIMQTLGQGLSLWNTFRGGQPSPGGSWTPPGPVTGGPNIGGGFAPPGWGPSTPPSSGPAIGGPFAPPGWR